MPLAVCATPIGNLDDVTLRLLEELRSADVILCEDTRHTRVLLDRHGISGVKLLSYHEHNEAKRTAELLPRLLAGERVALVSDAGMPGISDPGHELIRGGETKSILRRSLPDLLPEVVRTRRDKLGFVTPTVRFFRGALGDLASEVFRSRWWPL